VSAEQRSWDNDLAEARQLSQRLSASLPEKIEVAAIGTLSKAPFQLLTIREALFWRTEELARSACDALYKEDFAVAALTTRALAESAAMVWYLLEILQQRSDYSPAELNDRLMRMFAGSKQWSDAPQAINVLTFVERMDRTIPGFAAGYASLSEYAHPNWIGVSGLYSKIDRANFTVHFGRSFKTELAGRQLVNTLVGALLAFESGYNKIADIMPLFVGELEKIWPDPDKGPPPPNE
jgi:hypothetical protein